MSEIQTLHFKLGDRFGQIISDIAQEHIQYDYDLQKGIDTIEKGLMGIPRDMVLDVLTGDKIIMVKNEECFVTERHKKHDALDYRKFNPSKWSDNEIEKLVKSGDDLSKALNIWIKELKYKKLGHFNIDFNSSSLMKYIFHGDDSEIFMKIEDEFDNYRQLQLIIDAYLDKANTTLNCINDLYKLSKTKECKGKPKWVIDIPPTLQVIFNIKMQIKELVAISKQNKKINFVADSQLDRFLVAQREIDVVEEKGIQTINISDNYNAIWLAPNGDCYGLNGEIANQLHNQMADMLKEANIIDSDDSNPDLHIMKLGWLKLHNGEVLGDHVYHEILITKEQKTQLIKYTTVQPDYVIYMNHKIIKQFISKSRLEMTELGALTDMLNIDMTKEGSKKKLSIRNIRKNPNFK